MELFCSSRKITDLVIALTHPDHPAYPQLLELRDMLMPPDGYDIAQDKDVLFSKE